MRSIRYTLVDTLRKQCIVVLVILWRIRSALVRSSQTCNAERVYSCPNWLGGALGRGFGIDKTFKDGARIIISSTDILSVGTFEESCLRISTLMIDSVFAALYRPQHLVIFLDPRVLLIN